MLLALVLYFLYAVTFVLAKGAVSVAQPVFFVGVRMIVGGALLAVYHGWYKRQFRPIEKRDWYLCAQVAFFNIFLAYIAEFWAIQYVTASKTSLLFNLTPFITAVCAHWVISERLTGRQWIGLCVGFLGLVPILVGQDAPEQLLMHVGFLSSAEIILLIGVAGAAYSWILFKKLVVTRGYKPIEINAVSMLMGGMLALALGIMIEPFPYIIVPSGFTMGQAAWHAIGYMAALILVVNIFSYNMYGHLLRRYSATFLSFIGFVTPLFTALLDWIILGERVGLAFCSSLVIISGGLALFYKDEQ